MTTENQPQNKPGKVTATNGNSTPVKDSNPKTAKAKAPSKIPLIVMGVSIVFVISILMFALFQNSKLRNERNQAIEAYNSTKVIANNCQNGNSSICLYAKTTAVDDYLMIIARTLQIKPSTSYDIMLEVVPSKLAPKEAAINTDCRPNNHHLYICQRMTTASPKKLLESLLVAYDNLNPNIEYNVSLILTPRATLVADDSQPNNMQMAPNMADVEQTNPEANPLDNSQTALEVEIEGEGESAEGDQSNLGAQGTPQQSTTEQQPVEQQIQSDQTVQ